MLSFDPIDHLLLLSIRLINFFFSLTNVSLLLYHHGCLLPVKQPINFGLLNFSQFLSFSVFNFLVAYYIHLDIFQYEILKDWIPICFWFLIFLRRKQPSKFNIKINSLYYRITQKQCVSQISRWISIKTCYGIISKIVNHQKMFRKNKTYGGL